MKSSAYLINTARGDIVNENELVIALKEKIIKGAGLDVYEKEPEVNKDLLQLKNVFLLPHLGSATSETREAMGFRVFENISAFFNNKEPMSESCLITILKRPRSVKKPYLNSYLKSLILVFLVFNQKIF